MSALFLLTLLWLADDQPINPLSQQNHQAVRLFSLTHRYEHFQPTVPQRELKLKFTPIIRKTEQVWIDGKQLRPDQDYQIDYDRGHIQFNLDLLPNQEIRIAYQTLPFQIPPVYKRDFSLPKDQSLGQEDVDSGESASSTKPDADFQSSVGASAATPQDQKILPFDRKPGIPSPPDDQPTLRVAGSQTFGVSIGTGQSLTQNQELRVNIFGNVSENIGVTAMLSDRDLPIQPEGTTESIQDLDQKLIRITSPNVNATLGDLTGDIGNAEIQFPMALEGVFVEGNFRYGSFRLIPSAVPKGRSAGKTMRGQEGRSQYRIDVDGQFVVVKADSEIVWLNGQQMRRGRNNDYVIRDYGDPIIEFTSQHIITSNDLIRVDFEYIPEDLAYQRSIQGFRGIFKTPDESAKIGVSYAIEADHDDPDSAFILLSEQDLQDLRQNRHVGLIAPRRHTVWGVETQLEIMNLTLDGQIAFSTTDTNTFSARDAKMNGHSWGLRSSTQYPSAEKPKLAFNLDFRDLDANYRPVGASSQNRNRYQYSDQYENQRFDDQYLTDTPLSETNADLQSTESSLFTPSGIDERVLSTNLQFSPFQWIRLDGGLGRTTEPRTVSSFHNLGLNLIPQKWPHLYASLHTNRNQVDTLDQTSDSPNSMRTTYRKRRQQLNLSYRYPVKLIGQLSVNGGIERLLANDPADSDGPATQNLYGATAIEQASRKRQINSVRTDLRHAEWATLNSKYAYEVASSKRPLLTIDDRPLTFSDWQPISKAKTWSVGAFSQVRRWVNLSSNVARRRFNSYARQPAIGQERSPTTSRQTLSLPPDTTTQLADINLRLTPFSGAVNFQLVYELDKKLATNRREVYTDINPYTGRQIQVGEGHYVKIDELHYVEDYEKGQFIKIIQNLEDKPVSTVDAKVQLRVRPRAFRPMRQINSPAQLRRPMPSANPLLSDEAKLPEEMQTQMHQWWNRWLKSFSFSMRHSLTEEQEGADQLAFYLLQQRQQAQTVYGRHNQRYQATFSPSPQFSVDLNYVRNASLNRRVNNRERNHRGQNWNLRTTINPSPRFSVGWRSERRQDLEQFTQIGLRASESRQLSNLDQFEQSNELDLRYELNQNFRVNWIGMQEFTRDTDSTTEDPPAQTQTLALENQITYSLVGKGKFNFSYRLAYGKSSGGTPFIRYNFYQGLSHKASISTDYRLEKFTDLHLRFNYRLLSTELHKPEHRAEMEVRAEL